MGSEIIINFYSYDPPQGAVVSVRIGSNDVCIDAFQYLDHHGFELTQGHPVPCLGCLQRLLDDPPDLRRRERFADTEHTHPFQKRFRFLTQCISGKENDT